MDKPVEKVEMQEKSQETLMDRYRGFAAMLEIELKEYKDMSRANWYLWHFMGATVICSSIATTLIAVLMDKRIHLEWQRWALGMLPAIGTSMAAFGGMFEPKEKVALREEGRIQVPHFLQPERVRLQMVMDLDPQATAQKLLDFMEEFKEQSLAQHLWDVKLRLKLDLGHLVDTSKR
jgi:hypothetical protein